MEQKPINGFKGQYAISASGDVISYRFLKPRVLKTCNNGTGYLYLPLWKKGKQTGKLVHRLVAEAFVPNPLNKKYVNHKDGNKYNNHYNNLEWVDAFENMNHALKLGLLEQGETRYNSKLTNQQIDEIRSLSDHGVLNCHQHAKKINVSFSLVARIARREVWKSRTEHK